MSKLHAAIAATLVLSLLGSSSAAVMAQPADDVAPAAGVNADKVDGKNAVKATSNKSKRSGKLMAFSAQGYLPNNIILKAMDSDELDGLDSTAFATLAALQSPVGSVNEADNPVNWNQLQNVPAGLADGTDNGITAMTFTQVVGTAVNLPASSNGTADATCPAGSVPVSGGHTASSYLVFNVSSFRTGAGWIVAARNTDAAAAHTLTAIVHCVTAVPATGISSISIAKKAAVKSAKSNKPPTPKKGR
jgi:hypothetical protein